MPRKTFTIAGHTYKRFEDVKNEAKRILWQPKKLPRQLFGQDFDFALGLLEFHPSKEKKLSDEVVGIKIHEAIAGTGQCFCLQYSDGTEQDFSHKALKAKCYGATEEVRKEMQIKGALQQRQSAYREAVQDQISYYLIEREQFFLSCDSCGALHNLTVDHVRPFVSLVKDFEKDNPDVPLVQKVNSIWGHEFKESDPQSEDFVRRWQQFHQENAQLQILCNSCNASKGSKEKSEIKPINRWRNEWCDGWETSSNGNYYLKRKVHGHDVSVTCFQKFDKWNFIANVDGIKKIKGRQWVSDLKHCKLCAFDAIFKQKVKA